MAEDRPKVIVGAPPKNLSAEAQAVFQGRTQVALVSALGALEAAGFRGIVYLEGEEPTTGLTLSAAGITRGQPANLTGAKALRARVLQSLLMVIDSLEDGIRSKLDRLQ